jgi:hypothetical protein
MSLDYACVFLNHISAILLMLSGRGVVNLPRILPFLASTQLEALALLATILFLGVHALTLGVVRERVLLVDTCVYALVIYVLCFVSDYSLMQQGSFEKLPTGTADALENDEGTTMDHKANREQIRQIYALLLIADFTSLRFSFGTCIG